MPLHIIKEMCMVAHDISMNLCLLWSQKKNCSLLFLSFFVVGFFLCFYAKMKVMGRALSKIKNGIILKEFFILFLIFQSALESAGAGVYIWINLSFFFFFFFFFFVLFFV